MDIIGNLSKLCQDGQTINTINLPKAKIEWTPIHHTAFLTLKESVVQAPILCYLDPTKQYIVYTNASDDACEAQLSQEYDGMEFPIAFFLHAIRDT